MIKNDSQYEQENILINISSNLKQLMIQNNMNQKEFSKKMNISESTLSGYIKANKAPSISFLGTLKKHFPNISLDQFLFENLEKQESCITTSQVQISENEFSKYKGSYYLFYLDTNRKSNLSAEKNVHETIDLRYGVLYISDKQINNTPTYKCIAVFGFKKRSEVQKFKEQIDLLDDYDRIYEHLQETIPHGLYFGQLNLSHVHIFISLNRNVDGNDGSLIILNRTTINNDYYTSGLGTMNSVSMGRIPDPVVQLVALSRNNAYISDEQIKSQLLFKNPDININGQPETNEILKLMESFCKSEDDSSESTPSIYLSKQNKEILLCSYLEYLIMKNIENNQLWFARVSNTKDDEWYNLIKEAENYQDKKEIIDEYENTPFDSSTSY